MGGAIALDLQDTIGSLEPGKAFDALLVDVAVAGSPIDLFETDTVEDMVQKWFNLGDDRNILKRWVQGKLTLVA